MNIEILQLLPIALILTLAGLVQSVIGFGYALFAITPLLWFGIPLPSAIALVTTCTAAQTILASRSLRAEIPWSLTYKAAAVRIIFVIIGIFILRVLMDNVTNNINTIVGVILCILIIIQFVVRPRPVDSMHIGWGLFAWSSSGFLSGFCGMGGPPLVLWAMAHTWPTDKTRGFLFSVFALISPFQLTLLSVMFGTQILGDIGIGVAFSPIVYAVNRIGLPLGSRMDKTKLRRAALIVLFLTGLAALII